MLIDSQNKSDTEAQPVIMMQGSQQIKYKYVIFCVTWLYMVSAIIISKKKSI